MNLLLITAQRPEARAVLSTLRQHEHLSVLSCEHPEDIGRLLVEHQVDALILTENCNARSIVDQVKAQEHSLPVILLAPPRTYDSVMDLLEEAEVTILPPEEAGASYFPELLASLIRRHHKLCSHVERTSVEEERHQQQLELISALAQAGLQSCDLDDILRQAAEEIHQRFGYGHASILVIQEDKLTLTALAGEIPGGYVVGHTHPTNKGITGHAVQTREAVIVADIAQEPRFFAPGPTEMRSAIAIPILDGQTAIGVLNVESRRLDDFNHNDIVTLEAVCRTLGLIMRRLRVDEELRQRGELLRSMLEMMPTILTEFDLDTLLQRIVDEAVGLIPHAEAGNLLMLENDAFVYRGATGYDPRLKEIRIPAASSYVAPALRRGEVIHLTTVAERNAATFPPEISRALRQYERTEEVHEMLIAPFLLRGELVGYLTISTFTPATFNAADEEALRYMASMATGAIDYARVLQTERHTRAISEALGEISKTLTATLHVDRVLDGLLSALLRLVRCDAADIRLVFGDEVRVTRSHGYQKFTHVIPGIVRYSLQGAAHLRKAAQEHAPVLVSDTETYAGWVTTPGAEWMRAHLTVPIFIDNNLVGFLNVASATPNAFHEDDSQVLTALAPMAAIALHNAQLFQDESKARALAESLQEIGAALTAILDEEQVIHTAAAQLAQLMPFHTLIIALIEGGDVVRCQYSQGFLPEVKQYFDEGVRLNTFPLWEEVIQTGKGIVLPKAHQDRRWIELPGSEQVSAIIVPLRMGENVTGFLMLTMNQPDFYQPHHMPPLQSLADLFVIALSNAQLHRDAQQQIENLELLNRFGLEIGAVNNPAPISRIAVEQAITFTNSQGAAFLRYDPESGMLVQAEGAGSTAPLSGHQVAPGKGASGKTWVQQTPLIINNYATWSEHADYPTLDKIHALIALPITWQEEKFGVLVVFSQTPGRSYSQGDLRLLQLLSQQMAIALYSVELYHSLHRERDRLMALATIDQRILAIADNPEETLSLILKYTLELMELPKGIIALARDPDAQPDLIYTQGFQDSEETRHLTLAYWRREIAAYKKQGPWGYAAFERLPESPEGFVKWLAEEGVNAGLGMPLWIRNQFMGLLNLLDSHTHHWTEEELNIARMLAGQASIAMEKALLSWEIKQRLEDARTLNHVLEAVNETLDPDRILQVTCSQVRRVLKAPIAIAGLLSGNTITVAGEDREEDYPTALGDVIALEQTPLLQQAISERRTLTFEDIWEEDPDLAQQLQRARTRGLLIVPLIYQMTSIGFIAAESPIPYRFKPHEVTLMESVARAISPALMNAHLHQETEEARQRVEEAYAHLQQLDAMKSQFIQNVSHELRTPLGVVKGYVDMALDETFGFKLDSTFAQVMSAISTHTNHLADLVESITAIEDIEMGSVRLTPQPIRSVCLTAIQSIWQMAMRKGMEIVTELPDLPVVNLDAQFLARALVHILDNAIKFNRENGVIQMTAWTKEDEVWIQVKDEGIGIPASELERVFERFYQVNGTTTRRHGGMGLGLSVAREVITRHDGRVWAESPGEGQGTTITIILPVYNPEAQI